ncbi:MAG: hypothetical protein D6695_10725 [Planctomycetota bacterium]|nr:MAG: hypothetical protein D6695_10725 [Planctomycetota bacterium]
MLFTGQAEITVDAKHRLALPAKFRARWDPKRDGPTWYCVPWPHEGVLRLYTERRFEQMAELQEETLTPDQDRADLEATLFGFTEQLDVDSASRIRLPAWHIDLIKLPREVVVVGARNRLEVRARDSWVGSRVERFNELRQLVARLEARKNAQ